MADSGNIAKDGYKTMLETLIKMFKDSRYSCVKQGEVFLLHLLDVGDHIDVENRVEEILIHT